MVKIYDISSLPSPPVLQDRATWFTNHNDNTFSGAIAMTTNISSTALDSDNGRNGLSIGSVGSNPLAPTITVSPGGTTVVISSNANFRAASDGICLRVIQCEYKSSTNTSVTVNIPNAD